MELLLYLFEDSTGYRFYKLIRPEARLEVEASSRAMGHKVWFIQRIDVEISHLLPPPTSLRARLAQRVKRWLGHAH